MARYLAQLRAQRAPVRASTTLPGSFPAGHPADDDDDWETMTNYSTNERTNPSVPSTPVPGTESYQGPRVGSVHYQGLMSRRNDYVRGISHPFAPM